MIAQSVPVDKHGSVTLPPLTPANGSKVDGSKEDSKVGCAVISDLTIHQFSLLKPKQLI